MTDAAMADAEDRAARWLRAWDSQGIHRMATAGDQAGADWLAGVAAALGARSAFEPVPVDRYDPVEAYLDIGGDRIDGVAVFDAPSTDGVSGLLGADIAVESLHPRVVYSQGWRDLRTRPGLRGLVVVCSGEAPGLGLLNAEQYRAPYGPPALHIDSAHGPRVLAAAAVGAPARIVARARFVRAEARNVVVRLPGRDPSLPPLVVMTPRSSWWESTSERGGGIVCWLETLRALLASPPARDVVLTANTGHELGHIGLDAFQAARLLWDRPGGAGWIHYGANIGAAGGRLSIVSPDEPWRAGLAAALAESGRPADELAPPTLVPSGETRDIHRAGGLYATLVGDNRLFHLPQDRWPHAVDVPAIARIARGAARFALARAG